MAVSLLEAKFLAGLNDRGVFVPIMLAQFLYPIEFLLCSNQSGMANLSRSTICPSVSHM